MILPGRPGRLASWVTAVLTCLVVAVAAPVGSVSAHNSLASTDPADGAVLTETPTEVSFVFDKPVPLDTATITFIDATGVRTEVPISHGPSGENEVLASLAGMTVAGDVTMRWRLVGADGHAVSGRVAFTAPPAGATAGAATTAPATATTLVGTATTLADGSAGAAVGAAATLDDAAELGLGEPANDGLAWLARFVSYVAIFAVLAVVLVDLLVWPGAASTATGRSLVQLGLIGVAGSALVLLVTLASDISGDSMLSAIDDLSTAAASPSGQALGVRVLLAAVAWMLLGRPGAPRSQAQWTAMTMLGLAMMGTWAWAGHSRTDRWPWLGVPADIAHHGAAALWIGGLALVAGVALRPSRASARPVAGIDRVQVMRRFSAVATYAVIVIVATGLLQTLRLHEDLGALLSERHGRLLAVKVVLVAGMLAVAAGNRRRVASGDVATFEALRKAMLVDVAVGIVAVAITASLVVAPLG